MEFFKTGLFAIGGGMATVPFLYSMSDSTGWFTHAELADMIAVGESTPGPIGVNMATYVGYAVGSSDFGVFGGILGALSATLGLVMPSVIIILIAARILDRFGKSRYVTGAFYGLRPASVALIAAAGFSVAYSNLFDAEKLSEGIFSALNLSGVILAAVLWILSDLLPQTKKLHPIFFIALSAAVGIICRMG